MARLGTYDIGASKPVTFDKSCDVPLLCNVHAEMSAYVVVMDNPYFSVTGADGAFKIENVPPGTYNLKTWHEKLRSEEQEVKVEGGKTVEVTLHDLFRYFDVKKTIFTQRKKESSRKAANSPC